MDGHANEPATANRATDHRRSTTDKLATCLWHERGKERRRSRRRRGGKTTTYLSGFFLSLSFMCTAYSERGGERESSHGSAAAALSPAPPHGIANRVCACACVESVECIVRKLHEEEGERKRKRWCRCWRRMGKEHSIHGFAGTTKTERRKDPSARSCQLGLASLPAWLGLACWLGSLSLSLGAEGRKWKWK